jgi:hypothetical protein
MAPALIRGAITAERQAREGETTKSGYSVAKAEEFEMRDLIAQVLGFTPTMLAEIREQKRGAQGWQDETKSARDKLFRSMREVLEDPSSTADDVQEVWDEIEDFNDTLPRGATGKPLKKYRIDRKDVAASLRSRKQREENTYRGVELSPGEEQYLFPDEYE